MSTTPGTGGGGAGGGAGAGAGGGVTGDDAGPAPSLATNTRHSMLLPEFHDVHKHTFRKPRTKPPRVKKPKKGGKGGRRGYRGRRRGISPSGRDVTGAPNNTAAAAAASAAAAAKGGAGEPEVLNCYCGAEFTAAAGDADEGIEPVHKLVAHKNEEGHWRCRQPGCTMTFHDFGKRKKHEQDMGRAAPNHTVRVGKRHCPLKVCHKTLTIDVMHEGPLSEDLFATHTHVVQHPFCWTCRTPFAHGRLLEEHAIATRHRLHPAQLTMYQFSKVVTVEAVYSGTSWGEGDPKEDDAISAKLRQWFLMDHDCRLGPLTVQPATMGFEARLQEARRNLIARGRTTHVPYLVALARVIALSHNGNKNGAYGYYPGRDRQVHASSATDSKDSDAKAGDADGGAAAAASTAQVFSPLPTVPERVEVLRKKGADLQISDSDSADSSDDDDDDSHSTSTPRGASSVAATASTHASTASTASSGHSTSSSSKSRHIGAVTAIDWSFENPKRGAAPTVRGAFHVHSKADFATRGLEAKLRCACDLEDNALRHADTVPDGDDDNTSTTGSTPASAADIAAAQAHKACLYQLESGDYNGHNIAAIAVDSRSGRVLGCQWNQCHLLKSTAAHAEERLIDRLFATADLCGLDHSVKYNKFLKDVIIYTSLEPCYQCAGKMIMAGVRQAVWLQDDPLIGASMLKIVEEQDGKTWKTRGYSAGEVFPRAFGSFSSELNKRYMAYKRNMKAGFPFYVGPSGKTNSSSSVPTFLCTDEALDLFRGKASCFVEAVAAARALGLVPPSRSAQPAKSMVVIRSDGTHVDDILTRWEAWDYLHAIIYYLSSDAYSRGGFA